MATDLWPEQLFLDTEPSPVRLLREQGSVLAARTSGQLNASVIPAHRHTDQESLDQTLGYRFALVVPQLHHYTYPLLWIEYDLNVWPVELQFCPGVGEEVAVQLQQTESLSRLVKPRSGPASETPPAFVAHSEQEFATLLKLGFSTQRTRTILSRLLAEASGNSES